MGYVGGGGGGANGKDIFRGLLAFLEDVDDGGGDVGAAVPVVHHKEAVLGGSHHLVIGRQERGLIVLQPEQEHRYEPDFYPHLTVYNET